MTAPSKDLDNLYRLVYMQFIKDGQIEAAQLWRESAMERKSLFFRNRRYTTLPYVTEMALISAFRELVKMGRKDLAKLLRDEVLENPQYRQLEMFEETGNNGAKRAERKINP